MDKNEFIRKLIKVKGLVCICEFGSYGTEYWIKDRSDIDLAVIVGPKISYIDTLDMEDEIIEISKEYYKYDNIHLTFILFNEFANKFSRMAIDSNKQYIVNEERWFDFNHYVLKYIRNNEQFEKRLKIDEQYSYFGRIIDESIL